jgi:hypothetical protein
MTIFNGQLSIHALQNCNGHRSNTASFLHAHETHVARNVSGHAIDEYGGEKLVKIGDRPRAGDQIKLITDTQSRLHHDSRQPELFLPQFSALSLSFRCDLNS